MHDSAGSITWKTQNKEKEVLHKVRRNWYLPCGQVFDLRAPDAWGERWDFPGEQTEGLPGENSRRKNQCLL